MSYEEEDACMSYPIVVQFRSIVLNEEFVVRVFELAICDPAPNVRQNRAAHWLQYALHHVLSYINSIIKSPSRHVTRARVDVAH
jgi:hypothetical protein